MALVISSPLVANVLQIINLSMALGNLPIAASGLLLIPISNGIWAWQFLMHVNVKYLGLN